ncbi:hypothetical protein [Bradyrhizobium sp. CCBAU 25338]|uniref:hypothetical protein n=1 Tax=Bradyrhizobium sp. CCBAU 25338 TaxID=1641877 RepID=UPI002304AD0F|nr:hypothetical protein [Bradyrhizobium sp. CCBAU 25338]MDA9530341.1 hypothetical protein [Bradyrhizobium sp. CCBAU 25338]
MSDLAHLQDIVEGQDRGAELLIKHPVTGEPTDVVLIVAGPDSDVQRRARLKMQDALYAFRGRPPADDFDRLEIERLARCIVGWRVKRDGQDVPFAFNSAVKLLTEMRFIREQVEAFAASRVDYFLRVTP